MKTRIIESYLLAWSLAGCVYAEGWQTNDVSAAKAVQIASCLWHGMSEEKVVSVVETKNGLKPALIAGIFRGNSWTRVYTLSEHCALDLEIKQEWGRTNQCLSAASIQSNGVKIVSITLTNAP
jgi:hypothetical protein